MSEAERSQKARLAAAARYYTQNLGLAILPCKGKIPLTEHGVKDAAVSADPWEHGASPNIGIATGTASGGVVVLDVDIDHARGKYGDESLRELEAKHGSLPDTWEVITGSGGRHIYFHCDDPSLTVGVSIAPGLDFRANGGYVIGPPSRHPDTGREYAWDAALGPNNCRLAELPEWLHQMMRPKPNEKKELPPEIKEGERNDFLFRAAARMRKDGLTGAEMVPSMLEINKNRCKPPLSNVEVRKICESVERYERGEEPKRKRGRPEKKPLTTDILEEHLRSKGITIRLDTMSHELEIKGVPAEYNPEDLNENLPVILSDELKNTYSGATSNLIRERLPVIGGKYRFHPVLDWLARLPAWDRSDEFPILYNILGIREDDELSRTLIKKWAMQCVALLHNSAESPFGADGILTLQGAQGAGKSSFFRTLGASPKFFIGEAQLDASDKDSVSRTTGVWIVELGELDSTLKQRDLAKLKSFITNNVDKYRPPYAHHDVSHIRRTSFCATVNDKQFLKDTTGNRRFWTICVNDNDIDLDNLAKFNVSNFWKQVEATVPINDPGKLSSCFRLTRDERKALEERNSEFRIPARAEAEVRDAIAIATESPQDFEWVPMTITEWIGHFPGLSRYGVANIGRALNQMGIEEDRTKRGRTRILPCRLIHGG